jgi:hypothetical protein
MHCQLSPPQCLLVYANSSQLGLLKRGSRLTKIHFHCHNLRLEQFYALGDSRLSAPIEEMYEKSDKISYSGDEMLFAMRSGEDGSRRTWWYSKLSSKFRWGPPKMVLSEVDVDLNIFLMSTDTAVVDEERVFGTKLLDKIWRDGRLK